MRADARGAHARVEERPRARWLLLSGVAPGLPQLLAGRPVVGGTALLAWGMGLAALLLGGGGGGDVVGRGGDELFARAAAVALPLAAWLGSMADLVRRPREPRAPVDPTGLASFRRNRPAVLGALVLVAVTTAALLAPLLAPWDPAFQGDLVALRYAPPSWAHPLGTDPFARDVLSRLLHGARVSLSVGILAVTLSVVLGTLVGSVAGFLGGWVDTVAMRSVDVVLAFPRIVLLVVLVAVFEPSLTVVVLVLGLTQWPVTARIVRGEVLSLREREFVLAARALGFSRRRILVRHLVPNALAPVIVTAALGVGHTIVLEAGLSFLGIGVQPPTPSWGGMVESGRDVMISAWWLSTFPGLALVVTVVAFNLVGDGLRDALDPRLDR